MSPQTIQPAGWKALGYQQITSLSSAAALTVPAGALCALIVCETQAVRWACSGDTLSATVGMPLAIGFELWYRGNLDKLRFIEQAASAKLNIAYYR